MIATKWKNLDVFHFLVKQSSAQILNLVDDHSNSLAHYVCQKNLREFLLCLDSSKIDFTRRNKFGLLPFELCADPQTHKIFSKISEIPDHPVYKRRRVTKDRLLLTSRFDVVRDILMDDFDRRQRVHQALKYKQNKSQIITLMSTAVSENKLKKFTKKCEKNLSSEPLMKHSIPSTFLTKYFEISFTYLTDFLKHCNDFRSFTFERPIGIGGFGEVWRVFNKRTKKRLAVKVINLKSKVKPKVLKRLVKIERDLMTQISHPFICKCLYSFKSQRRFYLFMEYCPYKDLGFISRVVLRGFGPRVVRFFLAEIVLAIGHLHSNNIIHRDIKTENVLMDRTGHTKLSGNSFGVFNSEC